MSNNTTIVEDIANNGTTRLGNGQANAAVLTWIGVIGASIALELLLMCFAYLQQRYQPSSFLPEWLLGLFVPEIWLHDDGQKMKKGKGQAVGLNARHQQRINDARSTTNAAATSIEMSMISSVLATLIPDDKEFSLPGFLQIDPSNDYVLQKQLTKGGAGIVYLAELQNEALVKEGEMKASKPAKLAIVKELITKPGKPVPDEVVAAFCQEVSMMWYFRNCPNAARLYGYCLSPMVIVMKYYELGSLATCIFKPATSQASNNKNDNNANNDNEIRKGAELDQGDKSSKQKSQEIMWTPDLIAHLTRDIASALKAMHQADIVHNDIKPDNVLIEYMPAVDDDRRESMVSQGGGDTKQKCRFRAVVTDFGISQIISAKHLNIVRSFKVVKIQGASAPYASPETFLRLKKGRTHEEIDETMSQREQSAIINTIAALKASDIYSLAVTMYEMINRKKAWRKMKFREEIEKRVVTGGRPEFDEKVLSQASTRQSLQLLIDLTKQCWDHEVFARPTADIIIDALDELLHPQSHVIGSALKKYRESMSISQDRDPLYSANKTLF
ncbi:hypothetical protein MIR68_004438 [Amoeboaphelidium protococcarum]|nr:hypothetical protein MIR68_004438 [Amoeboaphelidium protococcarum]